MKKTTSSGSAILLVLTILFSLTPMYCFAEEQDRIFHISRSVNGKDSGLKSNKSLETSSISLTGKASVLIESNANFPGIVFDGTRLVLSYGKENNLYLRPYDTDFSPLADATQITHVDNVTDHKHIFLNDEHFLLYSTI